MLCEFHGVILELYVIFLLRDVIRNVIMMNYEWLDLIFRYMGSLTQRLDAAMMQKKATALFNF